MKIFQTQNRLSIGYCLKRLLAVLFIGFLMYAVTAIIHIRYFSYIPKKYETSDEIITLFSENVSDFDEMVEIIKETDVLIKLHTRYLTQQKVTYPTGDTMSDPEVQLKHSGFVTDSQMEQIVDFFEKYNVYHLSDSFYFSTVYMFSFFSETHSVQIMYIDSQDALVIENELDYWRSFDRDIFHLDGKWYCAISETD